MTEDIARREEITRAGKRIEEFLDSLSDDELSRQSACDAWTVADVAAHLIERGRPIPGQIERGLKGDLTPTRGAPDDPPVSEEQFALDLNQRAVALRWELGNSLVGEFARVNREFERVLDSVREDDWDKLCYHRLRPETVRSKVDIRIAELAMHEWDIRWAFDRNASLAEESLPGLVNASGRAVRRAFRADENRTRSVNYRFSLTGAYVSAVDVTLEAQGAGFAIGAASTPDVVFQCSAATYAMIVFGRWKLDAALNEGLISVTGDAGLSRDFIEAHVGG